MREEQRKLRKEERDEKGGFSGLEELDLLSISL